MTFVKNGVTIKNYQEEVLSRFLPYASLSVFSIVYKSKIHCTY